MKAMTALIDTIGEARVLTKRLRDPEVLPGATSSLILGTTVLMPAPIPPAVAREATPRKKGGGDIAIPTSPLLIRGVISYIRRRLGKNTNKIIQQPLY